MVTRITRDEVNALPDMLTNESFIALFGTIPGESDNRRLTLQCTKCTFPERSLTVIESKIATFSKRQAGPQEFDGNLSLTFNETTDFAIYRRLKSWLERCNGTNSGVSTGYSEDYSITLPITIFDNTGTQVVVGTYYKVFPKKLPAIDLDSTGTGAIVELTVDFSYNYFTDSSGTTY